MLTAYDQYTAEIFDQAGIEVLLVGDSASNNVFGNETSLPVTVDELLPLCRAVARSARRALVVADLPFGSYEVSAQQAVATGVRFLKEGLAHAVKIEGGKFYAETVRAMVQAGIPVMAHIGFTPQSEHALGGYRVQGRGDDAQRLIEDAVALADAGAFSVLMEMVPAATAAAVDAAVESPPSASAPAAPPPDRSWCGRTWRACAAERWRNSSSSTPTCGPRSVTPQRPTARTCVPASSPARSTPSSPLQRAPASRIRETPAGNTSSFTGDVLRRQLRAG